MTVDAQFDFKCHFTTLKGCQTIGALLYDEEDDGGADKHDDKIKVNIMKSSPVSTSTTWDAVERS